MLLKPIKLTLGVDLAQNLVHERHQLLSSEVVDELRLRCGEAGFAQTGVGGTAVSQQSS